jgi:hypothetical protein
MRNVHDGDAEVTLQALQLEPHPQLLVERGKRLTQQQHAGRGDRSAGKRDAASVVVTTSHGRQARAQCHSLEVHVQQFRANDTQTVLAISPMFGRQNTYSIIEHGGELRGQMNVGND